MADDSKLVADLVAAKAEIVHLRELLLEAIGLVPDDGGSGVVEFVEKARAALNANVG